MTYKPRVDSAVDAGNSSTTNLTTGTSLVFTGTWNIVEEYAGISVLVDGTAGGTVGGTLQMQFSHDGVTVHRNITATTSDITNTLPRTLGVVAKYFRIIFTADSDLTSFDMQTMLHAEQVSLVSRLDGTLQGGEDVQVIRSISASKQPDGTYKNDPHNGVAFSTTANLGIDAVYTSSWIDTDGYNSIELFVDSDVVSANQGIVIEYTLDLDSPAAALSRSYEFMDTDITRGGLSLFIPPELVGFRLVYTNGGTAQTSFVAQCDLKTNGEPTLHNKGGALIVGDFSTEVSLGNVPNHTHGHKHGVVYLLDGADGAATIWNYADDGLSGRVARKTFLTTAVQMWVASDNAGDTTQTITITYNDSNNLFQSVDVNLNGTTAVDSGVTAFDVASAWVSSDDDTLAGNVYIQQGSTFTAGVPDDGTDVMAYIHPDFGRTQQAALRVPDDKQCIIDNVYMAAQRAGGVAGSAEARLRIKPDGGSWTVIRPYLLGTSAPLDKTEQIVLEAGTFIEFYVDNVSDTDTAVSCIFSYTLVST